ncbi:MAG: hypothetical protein K9G44_11440 [Melioribacteraceae bacterium]|nr:hypothetical protein [Melioribacteraceae bacterium]
MFSKFFFFLFVSSLVIAQNGNNKIRFYLDCDFCDHTFFREEIKFVDHVRDRNDADIHLLVLHENTGGSGSIYYLNFIGRNEFAGINDTIKVNTTEIDTDDDIRKKLAKYTKIGLMRFISSSPIAEDITIDFDGSNETIEIVDDPWNSWVFRTSLNTYFSGQESQNDFSLYGNFSIGKTTEDWKFQFNFGNSYEESNFEFEAENIKNVSRSQNISSSAIRSIDSHWSLGYWFYSWSSTYQNTRLALSTGPGIEYNFYPYSESSSKQFKLQYKIFFKHNDYYEQTIFLKSAEYLSKQEIELIMEYNQPWGEIDISLSYHNLFEDFAKNRVQLYADFEIKVYKGLDLDIYFGGSRIHDQITLPRSNASIDEVLLRQKELETSFEFWGRVGFSYTFGSIYNNIVNPRFEG